MAHHRNSQQYPQYSQSGPPLPPLPPQAGLQDQTSSPETPSSAYPSNGSQYQEYGYGGGQMPIRQPSSASRPATELFMPMNQGPPLPPAPHRMSSTAGSMGPYSPQSPSFAQNAYNPQDYAAPLSAASTTSGSSPLNRRPVPQQSYNPADYAPSNLAQSASPASYQHGFSPGYSPSTHGVPLPGMAGYQTVSGRPTSMINTRPNVQTSYSHYTATAPPPLPTIPSAGASQSEDWGRLPGTTRYTSIRNQHRTDSQQSTLTHGRTGSGGTDYTYSPMTYGSPSVGPPAPPPHGSLRTNTVDLQSRPLPRLPGQDQDDYFTTSNSQEETRVQEDLENEILASIGGTPSPRPRVNGMYHSSGEDDPEAMAGLALMQEAEKQEQEEIARRQSVAGSLYSAVERQPSSRSDRQQQYGESDGDVPAVDLASMGGGWAPQAFSYGEDPLSGVDRNDSVAGTTIYGRQNSLSGSTLHGRHGSQTVSSSGSLRRSGTESSGNHQTYAQARVDASVTGGLADPNVRRRLSFDEGDEADMIGDQAAAGYEFFHPGITNRPLPPPPVHSYSTSAVTQQLDHMYDPSYGRTSFQPAPSPAPGRHTSLVVPHTATPPALTPLRANTDADEQRRRNQRLSYNPEGVEDTPSDSVSLDLPGVTKRFNPAKLSSRDFNSCDEPWALSSLNIWLKKLVADEQYLKKASLSEALVKLFNFKLPTLNIADAETLADQVIHDMYANKTLYDIEEWVAFSDEISVGVIFQLSGTGCYSNTVHDSTNESPLDNLRCYSQLCQRTEKKIDLSDSADFGSDEDWVQHYKLTAEDIAKYPKKEIDRQNILHEIVQKEEGYVHQLGILLTLYRDRLAAASPPVITPKQLKEFLKEVFGKAEAVKRANEEYLLPQLKYRQKEQGPMISGFSSILREWIRKAKTAYLEYASAYPNAVSKVRHEIHRNMLFRGFLDDCQRDPRARRLDYQHFLKLPISRLQQLILLLQTAHGKSVVDNEEKRNLEIAIEEIKAVTHECDSRVGEGERKVALSSLQYRLKLRADMPKVELNLDHLGRELIFQGDLLRAGQNKFSITMIETHAILFDHFLVLAKVMGKSEQYDVSRLPIPMDLLVLESMDEDPVVRSTIAGVTKVAPLTPAATAANKLSKTASKEATPGSLASSSTSISLSTLSTSSSRTTQPPPIVTTIDSTDDGKIMYPFRIKHLGREGYILYAPSARNREEWCTKILEAKTKHANALFAQNAEPFKLKVIADTAFAYDSLPAQGGITIKGTPLDRAVKEVEQQYVSYARPGPACRARVNCATTFQRQDGTQMHAVGTDYGVYIAQVGDPRGWSKLIPNRNVTQIAVLEDFQLFLLIAERALIAYHLDVLCPPSGVAPANDSIRAAPQKVSGNRDVGFFATGFMKERMLVFYKKKDVSSSTFKVLEPVLQKSTERKSRFPPLRSGKTDFFRDFDEFYIPVDCSGMNVFNKAISVCSQKGFEILNLDRKVASTIPMDLDTPAVSAIAQRLQGQKPLGMFRLSDQEFLLAYEQCAVYVNKHGEISRSVIMEYVGRARQAALFGAYVLLFDNDFVEVRNANNGRLRQVISGRDVKCLDDGQNGGTAGKRTIKVVMQHPEIGMEKNQIVVEMVLNDNLRE